MIKIFNSLTRKKEIFKPISKGEVKMYSCGPTVYSEQHIGNMRTMLLADLLIRMFEYNGYKVNHVINYTDVGHLTSDADTGEDKVEKAAKKEGLTIKEITQKYIDIFESDIKKLNIRLGKRVRASEHIKEQIELIERLEKKGYTYKTKDGIYFDTSKMESYGKLSGLSKSDLIAGKRIRLGEKKNPNDFALWKFSGNEKRLQEWDSPWGRGFPGWHIECSAMSMKYLGETFDVHTGGQDLSQIHHNNEIAQSECATGKKFVNYWVHGGFLTFQGEKLSKSKGGIITLTELQNKGYKPEHYRYLCLLTHYKKPLNFTFENLDAAKSSYEKIIRKIKEIKQEKTGYEDRTEHYEKGFQKAINDDLNLPRAVQVFIKALDDSEFTNHKKLSILEKFDKVLGLGIAKAEIPENIPEEINSLLENREALRKAKKWKEADIIREKIRRLGYIVEDTPKGVKISKA